jgi:hypothetical protein
MAIDATDWSIDRQTKVIDYIGDDHGGAAPTYATVIQFHRWVQDLADDPTSLGDDEMDITDVLPSTRATDNYVTLIGGYTLGTAAVEHLYDGSIVWGGGDEIADGIVNYGNADVQIQIIQDGAVLTDAYWNFGGAGLNADALNGISHRFLIQTRTAGANIDGTRILGTCRRFGYTYSQFPINGTARGNNVLALSDGTDLNNATSEATVATWSTIANLTEGYAPLDVNNDSTPEAYYSEWNKDIYTVSQFYERMKWLTREGSASTLYGLPGELFRGITHEINVNTPTGTLVEPELLTWTEATVVSSGQLLATDSTTSATKVWIQLLTGIAPTDGTVLTGAGAGTVAVNVTVTDRSPLMKTPFVGASTGSSLIGSYGLSLETADLSASDKVFDLTNTLITPPNNVTFTVGGLAVGEDYVLVGPYDGTATDANGDPEVNYNQMALNVALVADNITTVTIGHANGDALTIPTDTPPTGFIRVQDDLGFYRKLHYSGYTTTAFTIDTTDGQEDFLANEATAGNNVWIAYLDKLVSSISESFTYVYNAPREHVIKVRDGGVTPIKEYITSGTMGVNGASTSAIRTTDL